MLNNNLFISSVFVSICRVSILWQRAPPVLPRRWCSSHLFWYRSTGDSGECAQEGKLILKTFVHRCWMFINCCSSELWLGYSHKPRLCSNENKSPDIWEKSPVNERECVGGLWCFDYHMRRRTTPSKSLFTLGLRIREPLCHRMLCNLWCHWEARGFERARISRFGALWCSHWLEWSIRSDSSTAVTILYARVLHWLEGKHLIIWLVSGHVMESWRTIIQSDFYGCWDNKHGLESLDVI